MDISTYKDLDGLCLPRSFYLSMDVDQIAQGLLGKFLCTQMKGQQVAGMIVETEAYRAPDDQACHAYQNLRTSRTETMFAAGSCAYVYLCYGIHHLFNVVTAPEGFAHAVLIRGLQPVDNIPEMLRRRQQKVLKTQLSAGPGVLTKALGINALQNGCSLLEKGESRVWIEDRGVKLHPTQIQFGTRVGIASAGEDRFRPWRFSIHQNPWVSKAKGESRE